MWGGLDFGGVAQYCSSVFLEQGATAMSFLSIPIPREGIMMCSAAVPLGFCDFEQIDMDAVLVCHSGGPKSSLIHSYIPKHFKLTRDCYTEDCD